MEQQSPPQPTHRPLDGLVVLDLTLYLSGPFATQILGGLGARVIKVEQPGLGDPIRATPPYYGSRGIHLQPREADDLSLSVLKRNRNKESITLNLKSERGRDLLYQLVAYADVLVENFAPGVAARLGLDEATLHQRNPRLIIGAISGFGQDGPYRSLPAYDIVVQAMSGLMTSTGEPDGPPTRNGPSFADLTAGLYAMIGILAALYQRDHDPAHAGQSVEVAMLDSLFALVFDEALDWQTARGDSPRTGNRRPRLTPFGVYEAADGFIAICAVTEAQVATLFRTIERPDLLTDPRYATLEARVANAAATDAIIEEWTRPRTRAAIWQALQAAHIPAGPVAEIPELLADPQLHAREMITPLAHPTLGANSAVIAAGLPLKFSRAAAAFDRPAPFLGADNERVYGELLQLSPAQVQQLREQGVI